MEARRIKERLHALTLEGFIVCGSFDSKEAANDAGKYLVRRGSAHIYKLCPYRHRMLGKRRWMLITQ